MLDDVIFENLQLISESLDLITDRFSIKNKKSGFSRLHFL